MGELELNISRRNTYICTSAVGTWDIVWVVSQSGVYAPG